MLRLLLFLALGFIIWKIVQIALRSSGGRWRGRGGSGYTSGTPKKPKQDFSNVQDADFEELPPEKKQ